jgi:hypothetical protein
MIKRVQLCVLALLLAGLGGLLVPALSQAAPPPPGPPLGALPASVDSTPAPGGNTGGTGNAALNSAVASSCNAGRALAGQEYYTLPVGNLGKVYARAHTPYTTSAHSPGYLTTKVALVDWSATTVLSCTAAPTTITASQSTAAVVWFDAAELTSCRKNAFNCTFPTTTLLVATTTGSVPGNDLRSSPHAISALPYSESGDSSFATGSPDDPQATATCTEAISLNIRGSVWWKYVATATGDLPVSLAKQQLAPPYGGATAGAMTAALYTSSLVPVQPAEADTDNTCGTEDAYPVTAGQTYYVQVFDENDDFWGAPDLAAGSPFTLSLGRIGTLAAPDVTAVDNGSGSVTLSWTPTARSAGTGAPTSWKLTRSGTGTTTAVTAGGTHSYTFTGLALGSTYTFTVRGVNAAGDGVPGTVVVRSWVSHAVAALSASLSTSARTATASWTAPTLTGGSAVTGYRVSRSGLDSGGNGAFSTTVPASTHSYTFTALLPTETYDLVVQPINGAGPGIPRSTSVVFLGPPSEPTDAYLDTDAPGHAVSLYWEAPTYSTSDITGYRVSRDGTDSGSSGAFSTTVSATTHGFTFSFLNGWEPYAFSVQAINASGTGPASSLTATLSEPTPARPTSVVARPGNAAATITWVAPTNTGSTAVTSYRVRRFDAATRTILATSTVGSGARSLTSTGLTNAHSYSFDVTASNTSGLGGTSVRSAVVVAGTPLAPTIATASGGAAGGPVNGTARWSPPAGNGTSAVTGYVVTALKLNADGSVASTTVSATQPSAARSYLMPLPSAGSYAFTVQAVNPSGRSAASARSNTVPGA